nr:MAG TPA: tail connector protein [Caudoviricetes sp.]
MSQLDRLKIWLPDEQNDELLLELLAQAEDAIKIKRRTPPELPMELQYATLQLEIAQFLYNKIGAEGEKSHNENGVNRTYENAHIPDSMLDTVIPLGRVVT